MSSLDSSSDLLLDLRSASSSAGLGGASDRDGGLAAESDKDNHTVALTPPQACGIQSVYFTMRFACFSKKRM